MKKQRIECLDIAEQIFDRKISSVNINFVVTARYFTVSLMDHFNFFNNHISNHFINILKLMFYCQMYTKKIKIILLMLNLYHQSLIIRQYIYDLLYMQTNPRLIISFIHIFYDKI